MQQLKAKLLVSLLILISLGVINLIYLYNKVDFTTDKGGHIPSLIEFIPGQRIKNDSSEEVEKRFRFIVKQSASLKRLINYQVCKRHWKNMMDSTLIAIIRSRSIFVYSAYLDEYNEAEDYFYTIRVFIYQRKNVTEKVYGKFFSDDQRLLQLAMPIEIKRLNGVSDDSWDGFIATFRIEREKLDNIRPCVIGIWTKNYAEIVLPIRRTSFIKKIVNNLICVMPNARTEVITPAKLTEFLAVTRAIGVDKIIAYVGDESPWYLKQILASKDKIQEIDLIRWSPPKGELKVEDEIFLKNECLYRGMAEAKFISFLTYDQIITPSYNFGSLTEAFDQFFQMHPKSQIACFPRVYYPKSLISNQDTKARNVFIKYETRKRCKYLDPDQETCIVRSDGIEYITEKGPIPRLKANHEVKVTREGLAKYAISRFYQDPNKGSLCNLVYERNFEVDNSIERFINRKVIRRLQRKIEMLKKY